ncbi:MAG: PEP-CTERM sorting domain-containing protein [Verrucomicrobiota bacterium]|jgi:hypothetical protein
MKPNILQFHLASGALLAALLLPGVAKAQTVDLYTISVDENGNGTYAEYSPPVVGAPYLIGSGTLQTEESGPGLTYILPYAIHINQNSTQWLGVYDADGTTKSDLVNWQNNGPGGTGTMTIYSNDNDGDAADVTPAFWSTIAGNWSGFTTEEDANGLAFYSTYIDTGGVPGDPSPHPTVEAFYDINSGVPEPSTLTLGVLGLSGFLLKRRQSRS